ncbi:membrane protein insertion efficiency factor YidD [candidate division KSB1 bacterium]
MKIISNFLIILIKGYRYLISPLFMPSCRFFPTCSEYSIESLKKHGAAKGVWLSLKRISRCHPFSKGGYDPVK